MDPQEIRTYNRKAWDVAVERGSQWTIPVSPEQVAAARRGDWRIVAHAHQTRARILVPGGPSRL